jgi:hypothetical protein
MQKEEIIELTNKVYKLTLLFPKKEPLRYKAREVADEILSNITGWEVIHSSNPVKFFVVDKSKKEEIIFEAEKNLEILKSYFNVAKWQNWASYFDILKIEEGYDKIKRDFKKEIKHLEEKEEDLNIKKLSQLQKTDRGFPPVAVSAINGIGAGHKKAEEDILNARQKKILSFLKEKGSAQVWQIKEIFPQVSKRTLRRDFEQLLKKDIIKRIGEKNNTFYRLVEKS